jgi:hypothetical protein
VLTAPAKSPLGAFRSRRWLLWFLVIVFLWSIARDVDLVLAQELREEIVIFGKWRTAFFAFASAMLVLDLASLWGLFRRSPEGFWICIAAAVASLAYAVVWMYFALDERSGLAAIRATMQEMLGIPSDPERTRRVVAATLGLAVLFRVVVIAALVKARPLFRVRG